MTLWFHTCVYMNGHFMLTNVIVTPKWRHIRLDVEECACATFPDSQESDFMLERTALLHLHDIGMSFRTGMKILPRYSYRGELTPVWLALVWDFVLASCKRTKSHKRELEWTRTGMKVGPVSCKHPLRNRAPSNTGNSSYESSKGQVFHLKFNCSFAHLIVTTQKSDRKLAWDGRVLNSHI